MTGLVTNSATSSPIRLAVVRAVGSSASTLSNDIGRFHLELPLGAQRLEVRRIGFRPATIMITVAGGTTADVALDPIAVGLQRILVTAHDDAARRIMSAAIRRKQETRGLVHDYHYDGDTRLVVRDLTKPADSASSIRTITQTRTSAYWAQPDLYQETIVARRQTGNIAPEQNLVGVGQIVNFSRDRVAIAGFELASPVADDALDRYEFRLLDTLAVGGRKVFRMSLEPLARGTPAFTGIIDVADSTFDVTGINVGVNDAVRLGFAHNVRYQQRFGAVGTGRWMPREIELSVDIVIPVAKVQVRVQQTAELSGYRFNEGRRPSGLGEYRIIVADSADRADSSTWTRGNAIPLTGVERDAFRRIDSIAHAPRSLSQKLVAGAFTALSLATDPDFFHYNRVDGAYVGAGWSWIDPPSMPGTQPTVKLGHAQSSDLWQYRVGDLVRLSEERRTWVGLVDHDETVNRATLTAPGYNATVRALFSTIDPLDYYRDRGLTASVTTKLIDFVRLDARYVDARQTSLPLAISRPPLRRDNGRAPRPNPSIDDGRLRAFGIGATYDSRPLGHQKGRDIRFGAVEFTRLTADAELSPGGPLGSDFNYGRYSVRLDRRQPLFGFGVTSLVATGGYGTRNVPAQRYFGVDGGAQVLDLQASPFSTLLDNTFTAPRAAVLSVQHNFDRILFTRSHLPLVQDIPFTLAVRGSMFWTDVRPGSGGMVVRAPYREAGFSVGNLTPYLAPFNFSARFAWQLSNYPTTPFRFSIGLGQ
ncbi:MAG: carboxypeptidase regulatory-like domain-containing protein [Gemmatimonadaceae bacterium]|nr:carboxypeptidase regulatory-like domain-containing protein [Gemmatimonadaceae bacterium]